MTSNAATDLMMNLCSDPATRPDAEGLRQSIHPELLKVFKPAFLGRLTVIPFFPLTDEALRRIVELQLGRVGRRVQDTYRGDVPIHARPAAVLPPAAPRSTPGAEYRLHPFADAASRAFRTVFGAVGRGKPDQVGVRVAVGRGAVPVSDCLTARRNFSRRRSIIALREMLPNRAIFRSPAWAQRLAKIVKSQRTDGVVCLRFLLREIAGAVAWTTPGRGTRLRAPVGEGD